MRDKIFISYSQKDNRFRERLEVHLKAITDKESFWSDKRVESGDEWKTKIYSAVEESAVAILLVSADFMASDFIQNVELPALLNAEKEDGIIIIPIMLYDCNYGELTKYQFFNTPNNPLAGLKKVPQEKIFKELSQTAVKKLEKYVQREEQKTKSILRDTQCVS
ncbi:hypothetical protein FACS1894132_13570 [Clostridia bacterium]|nr:hypothetical protein FACS1894132_13570 [Clostridia bacterium]